MRLSFGLLPFAVGCASAFSASICQAQASPSVAGRAKHFIVAEMGANTTIGVGIRTGDRTDLVLQAGGSVSDESGTTLHSVSLRPALVRYWGSTESSVAPYLLLGLKAEWSELDLGGSPRSDRRIGAVAGIGMEWFPTQRVSLGGNIGVEALSVRTEGPVLLPGSDPVSTGYRIGTVSSGIRLRLFF